MRWASYIRTFVFSFSLFLIWIAFCFCCTVSIYSSGLSMHYSMCFFFEDICDSSLFLTVPHSHRYPFLGRYEWWLPEKNRSWGLRSYAVLAAAMFFCFATRVYRTCSIIGWTKRRDKIWREHEQKAANEFLYSTLNHKDNRTDCLQHQIIVVDFWLGLGEQRHRVYIYINGIIHIISVVTYALNVSYVESEP